MPDPTTPAGGRGPAPALIVAAAALIGLAMAVALTWLASHQPYLGLRLAWDTPANAATVVDARGPASAVPLGTQIAVVEGPAGAIQLEAADLVVEPDGSLGTYDAYDRFLTRQSALAAIQKGSELVLRATDGRAWTLRPAPSRPLDALPPDYWVQILVGVVAWVVSAAIWAFRPREASARYLLLSGAATLMFAPFAAVYSTRELGLDGLTFRWISDLNFLGGSLFAAALFALLLYYPRKLVPRWAGLAVVGVFLAWFAAQELGAFESMTLARRLLVMIALIGTFVLAGVHWRTTGRDPVARASLLWFLLSWVIGVGVFGLGVLMPQLFGVDTSGLQAYGFLVFLLVYARLAFGILRYRLFELGEWWGRVVGWALGLVALAVFDMAFVAGLGLSAERSLSLALLACGLVWFPLRSLAWSRLTARETDDGRARFQRIVEIAFTRDPDAQADLWRALVRDRFDALQVEPTEHQGSPTLRRDGLEIALPAVGAAPALAAAYARGGRRLFNRRDIAAAAEMTGVLAYVLDSRDAYERGVTVERRRIARDIHDNLGATLLSALHSDSPGRKDAFIRETLTDLRSIVAAPVEADGDLAEALAGARREVAERLGERGVALAWTVEGVAAPLIPVQTLRAILREAVSNILKHADAAQVSIHLTLSEDGLRLTVEDDGRGFDPAAVTRGAGLDSIAERAAARGGEARWSPGVAGRGARLSVRLPVAVET